MRALRLAPPLPKLWRVLVKDLALDASLSWSLWTALSRARWSVAREWREAFLAFARRDAWTSAEDVELFFRQVVTLPQLVTLIEALGQEGALQPRDGRRLEEHLLARADAQGNWQHLQGPQRPERRSDDRRTAPGTHRRD